MARMAIFGALLCVACHVLLPLEQQTPDASGADVQPDTVETSDHRVPGDLPATQDQPQVMADMRPPDLPKDLSSDTLPQSLDLPSLLDFPPPDLFTPPDGPIPACTNCVTGCCSSGNVCVAGTAHNNCGNTGGTCVNCAAQGMLCSSGGCVPTPCGVCKGCCDKLGKKCVPYSDQNGGPGPCGLVGATCLFCFDFCCAGVCTLVPCM